MRTPRGFNARFVMALVFGIGITLVAPTGARAVDLDQRVVFDIQPQNLVSALIDFSRQSDLQVMSAGSDLKDRRTPGVHGQYAIGEALDLLLAGSGLSYKAAGPSTVAVVAAVPGTAAIDPPVEAQVQTAQAQTAEPAPLERVEVTGSHIKRSEAETVQNVRTITSQQIQQSGQETVADFLRTASSTFGNNSNESFANSFAPGAAMIGLRGLSQKDTLVLLNGRRITNYGLFLNLSDSFVDLNVLPVTAIDRVELLKSGGSAIYGSDAIAGVVNIILKQNTTEKTVEGGGRVTTEGGAASYEVSALLGFGDFQADNYNVVLSVGGFKRNQLLFSQRDYTKSLDFRNHPDGILGYRPSNQYSGVPEPFPTCGVNGLPGQVILNGGSVGPGCYYNHANELPLLPGTERGNLTVSGNLRLNADWTAFGDVFLSTIKTTSTYQSRSFAPGAWVFNPATGGVTSIPNTLLPTDPSAGGGIPTPGKPTSIFYDFQTVGPRDENTYSNTYRVTAGVKGNWLNWDWEGAYGHSENNVTVEQVNSVNARVLMSDLAAGANDPYNFLNPLSTPAATNALRVGYGYTGIAKLDTFGLKGTGGIFNLPGGTADAAAGVELRHESADEEPSASLSQGLVLNTGVTRANATRTVTAAFLEFDLPVIKTLEIDLAAREEHYTIGGSNFSPQATVRWQPIREFSFRAVGSKGFRAPSLAEGSNSTSLANQTAKDPLDPLHRRSEAVGFITGGNPNLRPETSKNLDLGFVVSPLNNVNFSVDYYSIWLYDVIASNGSAQSVINNPAAYPPGSLVRDATGAVVYAKGLYTNLYKIRTDGVDFEGDVSFPLPDASKLKFALDATYVPTFLVFCGTACSGPPTPWQNYAGSNGWDYASPISGGNAIPRWKGFISAAWQNAQWSAEVVGRFVDRYTNIFSQPVLQNTLTQHSVSPYTSVDLDGQYRWRNWKATLSIINVTDNQPPYDSSALLFGTFAPPVAQPFDTGLYDPLGRMIDLHLSYTF
ncbi:MAG TPA: TonB-dependent receptor [Burkholderiaceae bacterium]|nr:TonB-dependent receptor [Burkholderiaceae bacterium]